jgi:hypothetical protein
MPAPSGHLFNMLNTPCNHNDQMEFIVKVIIVNYIVHSPFV